MFEFGASLLSSIAADLAAKAILGLTSREAFNRIPLPLSIHRRELRRSLREMPFIYKDIDTDVLTDFVDIDIRKLAPDFLHDDSQTKTGIAILHRLRDRRKAIFLGSAGIGKTTFSRHTILSLLAGGSRDYLNASERVVPFYVPLKAVDNLKPQPIVRYLLKNASWLRGPRGPARLLRLARSGRVMLFLDGYDEIYIDLGATAQHNFIRDDLNWLIGKVPQRIGGGELNDIYAGLADCRAWLCSRFEFYLTHPLDLTRVYGPSVAQGCTVLGLRGIGNSRMDLVRKIFDKYRTRAKRLEEFLDEELFIQQIDRSGADELRKLSENPLFLTVMCYVYATRALENENPGVVWADDIAGLVGRCVDLLLRDLDAYRARDLPAARRAAVIARRNAFEREKRSFLPYFAWTVLNERKNVFDVAEVNGAARQFFSNARAEVTPPLSQLLSAQGAESLGSQLAQQGLFVVVERTASTLT